MATIGQAIPVGPPINGGGSSVVVEGAPPKMNRPKRDALIPTNVAGLILISAGVLVALNMMRFNFVVGIGSN